jgi:dTDP-4-dehydrorhamnose 3,5-epimerase
MVIELEPRADERGLFARTYCSTEFAAHGIHDRFTQDNLSRNPRSGTLRGMHYQDESHGESKLVRCGRGAIFDVAIDIRPGSSTWGQWFGVELTAEGGTALYIPAGLAHGFVTLTDDTDVLYKMGADFVPGAGGGVRWNDPTFGVEWPVSDPFLSERDAAYPDWRPE